MTRRERRKAAQRKSFWGGILAASLTLLTILLILSSGKNSITPFTATVEKDLAKCLADMSSDETCVVEYTFDGENEPGVEVIRAKK